MARLKDNPMVKRLVERGEERVSKLATQLLSSERFSSTLQTVVQRTLGAKGFMDKNLRLVLSAMNLPSTGDVRALHERLDDLERFIGELDEKVNGLAESRQGPVPRARA
jgi:polyhydroxyalkanoate synthesis regulator phasin